jgi:S-formylglutathione hydrolase FrmB
VRPVMGGQDAASAPARARDIQAPGSGAPDPASADTTSPKDRYLFRIPQLAAAAEARVEAERPGASEPVPSSSPSSSPRSGRLILFFTPDTPQWAEIEPAQGPFFSRPQPTASIAVRDVKPGSELVIELGGDASMTSDLVATHDLNTLAGRWRVQAVLDTDFTERGHAGPGNLVSEVLTVDLDPERRDEIDGTLARELPLASQPPDSIDGVEWISRRSALLSDHFGRDVPLRAGVVLPFGYHDLAFPRRMWPTIYVVGGFGGNHLDARADAAALRAPEGRGAIPQAVWVYLDADTPWGHSGFCDSDANGPIGRALVTELIPFLEQRFRLISSTDARVVTGHSSGGWTALHLALTYPETFGACFASAPDPVDFSAFQRTDLYTDGNLHTEDDGSETPSFRTILGPEDDFVRMTVRQERMTEHAIDPNGKSGQQWAAWDAMWSPLDPLRNAPRRIADPISGVIDPVTVEAWSRYDIARRFERSPSSMGPLFLERIRILCGTRDGFYLNEAVARLKAKVEGWRARTPDVARALRRRGYIELVDGLDHDTLVPLARLRFHREIAAHLAEAGHTDWTQPDPTWSPIRPESSARPTPDARP